MEHTERWSSQGACRCFQQCRNLYKQIFSTHASVATNTTHEARLWFPLFKFYILNVCPHLLFFPCEFLSTNITQAIKLVNKLISGSVEEANGVEAAVEGERKRIRTEE